MSCHSVEEKELSSLNGIVGNKTQVMGTPHESYLFSVLVTHSFNSASGALKSFDQKILFLLPQDYKFTNMSLAPLILVYVVKLYFFSA